jgi:tetratricopeptide (TPR) repeat protein
VREILDDYLKAHDPDTHREWHERAITYFDSQIAKRTGEEAERLELERLYHYIQMDEDLGIRVFQQIAEDLTRSGLNNRLRGLLSDVNTYKLGLKHESSRLWLEYYEARLARHGRRYADAEKSYQAISENLQVEPKLRAYALCDWGEILVKDEWLGQIGGCERAIQILEPARQAADIDAKLVFVFTHLSRVYGMHGEWLRAVDALQSQLGFFQQHSDQVGIVKTLAEVRWTYGRWGNWKKSLEAETQAQEIIARIPGNSFLKATLVEYSWIPLWSGRYNETEKYLRDSLTYAIRVDDFPRQSDLFGMLGYTLGLQNKFGEALLNFAESVKKFQEGELYKGGVKGFLGNVLIKQGELNKAEDNLYEALSSKRKIHDVAGIPEIFNWLGELFEIRHDWRQAASYYHQSLDLRSLGRRHFECGAFTGLVRVRQAQNDRDAIMPLLTEAESLAQQFEYNDHLASLYLTQAQFAWDGPNTLRYFQLALIYALRFNRFLLDEVLSGRSQGTFLSPIIPYLGHRGDEGQQMLVALREWWHTGVNDTGTPRPDTISPIPESIPLLEAEFIARRREPGDNSFQKTVIQQIDQVLRVKK